MEVQTCTPLHMDPRRASIATQIFGRRLSPGLYWLAHRRSLPAASKSADQRPACTAPLRRTCHMANEFVGLPAAFMSIGANGAVSSLWPASDGPTLFLMARLLRELHSGTPPARALKDAQLWLSNRPARNSPGCCARFGCPRKRCGEVYSRSFESATAIAGPMQSFGGGSSGRSAGRA